jgi:hypothetical protein
MSGLASYFNGRYAETVRQLTHALDLLKDGSTGLVHERVSCRHFLISALAFLGRFKELRQQQDEGLRDALSRGDIYGAVVMRTGHANLVWLMDDHPDRADAQVRDAMEQWPKDGFHVEHYYALAAQVQILLYRADAGRARALASELLRRSKASSVWFAQIIRIRALQLRAMGALLMAQDAVGDKRALLRSAARDARSLEREKASWARPLVTVVRAGIALRSDARGEAIRGLEAAALQFDAAEMAAYAAATRDRAARLRNDATSAADIEHAATFFRGQDVANPERFIAMLVPGFAVESSTSG